jgi:Ca2+-binding RTX toxin-like protein
MSNTYQYINLDDAANDVILGADLPQYGQSDYFISTNGLLENATINGGEGDDTISIQERAGSGGNYIYGGNGNDSISVNAQYFSDSSISGSAGRDIPATIQADTIFSGEGNDTIVAKFNDVVYTGKGDDLIVFQSPAGPDRPLNGAHGASIQVGDGNEIYSGQGGDTVIGSNYEDEIYGNIGYDSLSGGYGDDLLQGNQGNDTINGGGGNDSLFGGKVNDVFVFGGYDGNDTIGDFNAADDKLLFVSGFTGNISAADVHITDVVENGVAGAKVEYTSHATSGSLAGTSHVDSIFIRGANAAAVSQDLLFS